MRLWNVYARKFEAVATLANLVNCLTSVSRYPESKRKGVEILVDQTFA
jgi:hypothetical protein